MLPLPELSLVFIVSGPSTVTLQLHPTLRSRVRLLAWSQVFMVILRYPMQTLLRSPPMIALKDFGGDNCALGVSLDQTLNDSVDDALDTTVEDRGATSQVANVVHRTGFL